jgi:hypothetical protein
MRNHINTVTIFLTIIIMISFILLPPIKEFRYEGMRCIGIWLLGFFAGLIL